MSKWYLIIIIRKRAGVINNYFVYNKKNVEYCLQRSFKKVTVVLISGGDRWIKTRMYENKITNELIIPAMK